MNTEVKIVECPRDAMQGLKKIIPTPLKIDYINNLLQVGFDTIDFGSFVSPSKIPQMADTEIVLAGLNRQQSNTKLLAIIANERGLNRACKYDAIDFIGYPFSISETFQLRNTNKTILESIEFVKLALDTCLKHNKELVVYISMCFGNPYGDVYNYDIVQYWMNELARLGVKTISLSDTVGVANQKSITEIFNLIVPSFAGIEIGAHFHTRRESSIEKIEAAYLAGCRRFDGAIKGFGGCPMAKDELIGNMPTEVMIDYFEKKQIHTHVNRSLFEQSFEYSSKIF